MIIPPFLKEGDTIAIVATARKVFPSEIQFAIEFFQSNGFEVLIGKSIGLAHHQLAGTPEQRAADLQKFLDDPSVKAIFCAAGGLGTIQMVDLLDFSAFLNAPKWICGYSDVTVLHACLNNRYNCCSLHSLMPKAFNETALDDGTLELTLDALKGNFSSIEWDLDNTNEELIIEGILKGGNLSILYSLMGSADDFDPEDTILFIEEIDEYLYHIDRMLWGLRRSRDLSKLKAILCGDFTSMRDHDIPFGYLGPEIISDHSGKLSIPMIGNYPAGHEMPNVPLYLGMKARLELSENKASLQFLF